MMRLLLIGHGRMGSALEAMIAGQQEMQLLAAMDSTNIALLPGMEKADAALDFSAPQMLPHVVEYIRRTGTPLVYGTTGLSSAQQRTLRGLGTAAPVLCSANFALGIAVMCRVLRQIAQALPDFDKEITEIHHRQKADAPSGTAGLLLQAMDVQHTLHPVYGRKGTGIPREKNEVGIHSLRGGTVAGVHIISFFGEDEVLELTHKAADPGVFAAGALRAAQVLAGQPAGYYTLEDLLLGKQ